MHMTAYVYVFSCIQVGKHHGFADAMCRKLKGRSTGIYGGFGAAIFDQFLFYSFLPSIHFNSVTFWKLATDRVPPFQKPDDGTIQRTLLKQGRVVRPFHGETSPTWQERMAGWSGVRIEYQHFSVKHGLVAHSKVVLLDGLRHSWILKECNSVFLVGHFCGSLF
jgi:hypothetical protein